MNRLRLFFASTNLLVLMLGSTTTAHAGKSLVYIGTYTEGGTSEGIYLFHFDDANGAIIPAGTAGISTNPSFLAINPEENLLFAVGETRDFNGGETGSVASFKIDPSDGKLSEINRVSSGGGSPCHLSLTKTGKHLLVANYHGGNVAVMPVGDDGMLSEHSSLIQHKGSSANPKRQEAPHAHSINPDNVSKRFFAADLGTDELVIYEMDKPSGKLRRTGAFEVEPGSGPRHLAVNPKGDRLYLLNELKSTVTVIDYSFGVGKLELLETVSTLPQDYKGSSGTAEIQITPNGKFLYASNRGHDSIACFKIADDGKLALVEIEPTGGKTPRNFGIHPNGKFIIAANQNSNSLTVFAIDQQSGELTDTGHSAECPKPVCVTFYQPN
ncbi:MAG: 6-phosphogluconolactonase [Verrucomicrobiales bacterium]|jgi:6-phosphogluconolactonase